MNESSKQIDGSSLTPEELVAIGYGSCPGMQEGSITQDHALAGPGVGSVPFDMEYIVEHTSYDDDLSVNPSHSYPLTISCSISWQMYRVHTCVY